MNGCPRTQAEFNKLYQQYRYVVMCFCYSRLGNENDAEDATQETFAHLWNRRGEYIDRQAFPAWLYTVARYKCHEQQRRNNRQSSIPAIDMTDADRSGGCPAEAFLHQDERQERIRQAVDDLPLRQAEAVRLHHLRQMTVRETSEIMGVAENTVRTHLRLGLRHLRASMGADTTTGAHK